MTAIDRYSSNSLRRLLGRINSIAFKDETGELEYFGQKMVMLRHDAFRLLAEELEKRHAIGTANIILGIMGRQAGREEGKALMADVLLESAGSISIPVFIRNTVEETNLGYGKLHVDELDMSGKTVTVSTANSFEADTKRELGQSVCFFLLGYIEGLFSELLSTQLRGIETSCKGKGDTSCMFQIRPDFPKSKFKV
jgi:predicted hydrocarbon binding protein